MWRFFIYRRATSLSSVPQQNEEYFHGLVPSLSYKLASTIVSGTTVEEVAQVTNLQEETSKIKIDSEDQSLTTKEKVKEYFADIPIMAEVAYCESRFRQFNENGNVLRGIENSSDVGVMQINEKYHAATAVKLGINLYTLEGNMAYARYL